MTASPESVCLFLARNNKAVTTESYRLFRALSWASPSSSELEILNLYEDILDSINGCVLCTTHSNPLIISVNEITECVDVVSQSGDSLVSRDCINFFRYEPDYMTAVFRSNTMSPLEYIDSLVSRKNHDKDGISKCATTYASSCSIYFPTWSILK